MKKEKLQEIIEGIEADLVPLHAERDRRNALNVDLQKELDEQNAIAETARLRAAAIAEQMEVNWGKQEWVELKKKIGKLSDLRMTLRETLKTISS